MAQAVKNLPAVQEMRVRSLSWEDPLKKGMATHSSIPAWRIPWTEEPGGLQSMESQSVGHNWGTNTHSDFLELWLFFLYIIWWPLSLNIITKIYPCCCSVSQSRLVLCDPVDCSTPGLPAPPHLLKFAQVHVHCIGDAIRPSHPLLPSSASYYKPIILQRSSFDCVGFP